MADDDKSGETPAEKKKRTTKAMGDYEVGRGRPPKSGQFKPGQSGNPSGRRRLLTRRSAHASVRAARTMLWIVDGGKRVQVTAYEAMLLKVCSQALKGDLRARTQILRDKLKFARMVDDCDEELIFDPLPVNVCEHGGAEPIRTNGHKPEKKKRKTTMRIEQEANREIFDRVLARPVTFTENGKSRQIPVEEAIWRGLFADALNGNVKASAVIMRFIDTPASPTGGGLSDIIDEDGTLHVTLNIGDKDVITGSPGARSINRAMDKEAEEGEE